MRRRVSLLELGVYERIAPLASAYLQAYACRDSELATSWDFTLGSRPARDAAGRIAADLLAQSATIYGLSTYVWNARTVLSVARHLASERPESLVLLGGPQVAHQTKYLDPRRENLLICNGEGERTFANVLREMGQSSPDLTRVRGLTLYREGEIITTPEEDRIATLDDVPSPFLSGLIATDRYTQTVFETNRGCPFHCSFCYWGFGDQRVTKFDEQRILDELTWLAENRFMALFFADANFGMLPRDVAIAEHVVRLKERTGLPYMVALNSAKNKPTRLLDIATILQTAGVATTQSVAVQSLDDATLEAIDRSNIKIEAYEAAQLEMNRRGVGSYVELIWPLPGETLGSFVSGIERMAATGAQSFVIYPLLLLQNTTMAARRLEHAFTTVDANLGSAGEYELVVATSTVNAEDHDAGVRIIHAVNLLYNARGLYAVGRYLHRNGILRFGDLFHRFADYLWRQAPTSHVASWQLAIEQRRHCDWSYWGEVLHAASHEARDEFDRIFLDFARSQPWWSPAVHVLYELDLVSRPYCYSNTPIRAKAYTFEHLEVDLCPTGYSVTISERWSDHVLEHVELLDSGPDATGRFVLEHRRNQMPFKVGDSLENNYGYCYGLITTMRRIVPTWRVAAAANS